MVVPELPRPETVNPVRGSRNGELKVFMDDGWYPIARPLFPWGYAALIIAAGVLAGVLTAWLWGG